MPDEVHDDSDPSRRRDSDGKFSPMISGRDLGDETPGPEEEEEEDDEEAYGNVTS